MYRMKIGSEPNVRVGSLLKLLDAVLDVDADVYVVPGGLWRGWKSLMCTEMFINQNKSDKIAENDQRDICLC